MPSPCVFIGDAVSAAGFRLAGMVCSTPSAEAVTAVFRGHRDRAGLVLITAELAAHLPADLLATALREQQPPVLVIADLRGQLAATDPIPSMKRQLGLAE